MDKQKREEILSDPANEAFMQLVMEDAAERVGSVGVDNGHIQIGSCDKAWVEVKTACGDGIYPVWAGKKYIVIEHDLLNVLALDEAVREEVPEE